MKAKKLSALQRDILIILVIKLCLLSLIRHLYFSEPTAKHMQVSPQQIQQQLLSPSSHSTQESTR